MKFPNKLINRFFIFVAIIAVASLACVGLGAILISIAVPHLINSGFIISTAYNAVPTFTVTFLFGIFIGAIVKKEKGFFH